MKIRIISVLALLLAFACNKESVAPVLNELEEIEFRASVTPVVDDDWKSGDALFECNQAGDCHDFAWKVDAAAPNGVYSTKSGQYGNTPTTIDNTITIYDSDGKTFSWQSTYEVCAVIVKAGTGANIYYYDGGSCGDEGLVAYDNKDISHVTFCFTETPCNGTGKCYQDETAWADGDRYTSRGNWATYTEFTGDGQVVDIYAGRNLPAGTATFTDKGNTVEISISLANGFIFYYDVSDPNEDENLKVQDYEDPPSGNPAPGLFDHKATVTVGATSYTITVPKNNYYGIHLDVAYEVPCE